MDTTVELNIGGKLFKTRKSTLMSIDGSYLSNLENFDENHFDRDPFLFRHILNAYRDGVVHVPRDVCPRLFKNEMVFWKIPFKMIAPCCWKYMYEVEDDIDTLEILLEEEGKHNSKKRIGNIQKRIKTSVSDEDVKKEDKEDSKTDVLHAKDETIKARLWIFLEEPASSTAAKVWLFFYIFVVILSVVVYIVWLDPSVRVSRYLTKNEEFDVLSNETVLQNLIAKYNEKLVYLVKSDPHPALFSLDIFCVVFFILETLIHFCVCPNKLRYFLKPYHILKVILCVAMVISTFFEFRKDLLHINNYNVGRFYYSCKSLSALRLLLIFRLHKIYNGFHIMILSLKHSRKELGLLMFSFIIAVVVYGCLMFSAEIETKMFPSTQIAMWWSLITMTTVGYGDFYPVSTLGYIVGVLCAVNGIIVLALPVAAIASTFSGFYSRNADLQKHIEEVKKQEEESFTESENNNITAEQNDDDNENKWIMWPFSSELIDGCTDEKK